ncbi:MAG: alpha/beta hydrolase [Rhodospirillales bacterium]
MSLIPAFDPPHADESPEDAVRRIEALADIRRAPNGPGHMIWHVWGTGTPLVLLHGGYGSWLHWIRNIPYFAKRFTVFAASMPGFGDSSDLEDPQTIQHLASVVSAGIDHVIPKDTPFHMVGFSFGGIVGGNVAALQGERQLSHTFSGSSGMGLTRNRLEEFHSWRAAETEEARMAAHRKNLEILMIADPNKVDDLALYIQNWNTPKGRVRSHKMGQADSLSEALSKANCRLMGLYGSCDAYGKGHLHERVAYLSKFRDDLIFRQIEGAGHWACFEAADTFNEMYLTMLDEIGA